MSIDSFAYYGYCPICDRPTRFEARALWFRDHLLCSGCASVPRERALMHVLNYVLSGYPYLQVHESSPTWRALSTKLRERCPGYSYSYFFPGQPLGEQVEGRRNEDLQNLTFPDGSFDLFLTQDVMEHIPDPHRAFSEIGRVLKPGGMSLLTVPITRKFATSEPRVRLDPSGTVVHLKPPEFHNDPVHEQGSLVTYDWGYDICSHILDSSGLRTVIFSIDKPELGIQGEYNDVLVCFK